MRHPKRFLSRDIRTRRPLHPGREADELEAVMWPASLRVKECMTQPVVTIGAASTVTEAAATMCRRKIRHLPVVDGQGRILGVLTDRDLRPALLGPAVAARVGDALPRLEAIPVEEIMTWAVITVQPDTALREAARMMYERKIGALPVVTGRRVVGILTESDVLRAFVDVVGQGLVKPYRWAFAWR